MIGDTIFYGVAVPTILVLALVAFIINLILKRVLAIVGVYQAIWHPALFDFALFVIVLCGAANISQWVQS